MNEPQAPYSIFKKYSKSTPTFCLADNNDGKVFSKASDLEELASILAKLSYEHPQQLEFDFQVTKKLTINSSRMGEVSVKIALSDDEIVKLRNTISKKLQNEYSVIVT